jgi:hypothetical protein
MNAGSLASYVFSMPPRGISAAQLQPFDEVTIAFPSSYTAFTPPNFAYEIGTDLSCALFAINSSDTSFLTLQGLLEIASNSEGIYT